LAKPGAAMLRAFSFSIDAMAGIAHGSEWIEVRKLREILNQLPDDAQVQTSSLGNLVIYDNGGPIDGKQIAYVDLLTETIHHEPEGTEVAGQPA
jgi:hypothetical protein